jgi:hypothetical protein
MGLAAIIGMAVGLVGVIMVFITFRETRRTADIAEDTAKRQLRAYLSVTPISFGIDTSRRASVPGLPDEPPRKTPIFQVVVKNVGQTYAHRIRVFAKAELLGLSDKDTAIFIEQGKLTTEIPEQSQPDFFLQPQEAKDFPVRYKGQVTPELISDLAVGLTHSLGVFGHVSYLDAFGDEHETPFGIYISAGESLRRALIGKSFDEGMSLRFEGFTLFREIT